MRHMTTCLSHSRGRAYHVVETVENSGRKNGRVVCGGRLKECVEENGWCRRRTVGGREKMTTMVEETRRRRRRRSGVVAGAIEEERTRSASVRFGFSAGGLLFPFYVGVCRGLMDTGYLSEDTKLGGASAGSLIAACVNSGLSMDIVHDKCLLLMKDCRENGSRGRLGPLLETFLRETLPEDAHERCSGKTHVAVTQTSPSVSPLLVSEFHDKEDLIRALMTSCHIPIWMDGTVMTEFRGSKNYLDGGVTNFIPLPPESDGDLGVRVTCFASRHVSSLYYGDIGISPDTFEECPYSLRQMIQWAFSPAEDGILAHFVDKGERDATAWARQQEKELLLQ